MTGFSLNPIALKEMRTRMRGPRTSLLLTSYLLLLAIVIYVIYIRSGGGSTYSYGQTPGSGSDLGPTVSYQIGQNIFIGVFLFLLLMVSVLTPAITAGAISREVESRTYDLLLVTPAYGRPLAFGKLFAALAFIFCMLLTALPLICVVFVFGGVSFVNIAVGLVILLLTACAYGAIGLFFSAWLRRTAAALTVTYSLILILTAGTWLVSSSLVSLISLDEKTSQPINANVAPNADPAFNTPKRLLVVNPLAAIGSVLAPNTPYRPLSGGDLQLFPNSALFGGDTSHYYQTSTNRAGRNVSDAVIATTPPLWAGYLLAYTIVSLLFLTLTLVVMQTYRRPRRRATSVSFKRNAPPPVSVATQVTSIENPEASLPVQNPPTDEPPKRRIAQG